MKEQKLLGRKVRIASNKVAGRIVAVYVSSTTGRLRVAVESSDGTIFDREVTGINTI